MNVSLLCDQAVGLHQRGRLSEAEELYRQILAIDPANFMARHLLGIIRASQGRYEEALELIAYALRIDPGAAEVWLNYANVLRASGRLSDALASYDKALVLRPGYGAAFSNRGVTLFDLKRFEEALLSYDKALAINASDVMALSNRGNLLRELGRLNEALTSYDKALIIAPDSADVLYNRGATLCDLKRPQEALANFDEALAIRPDYAEALSNRGMALSELKNWGEALASFDRALAITPNVPEILYNRANILLETDRASEALINYERALRLRPAYPDALCNRGIALFELKRGAEALASLNEALALRPGYVEAHHNRANVLADMKLFEDAKASYTRVLELEPGHRHALGGMANAVLQLCQWDEAQVLGERMQAAIRAGAAIIVPFILLGFSGDPDLQRQCAQASMRDRVPTHPPPLWTGERYTHERIRIAYLSSDLRQHPVGFQMAHLFEHHDRSRFEIIGISTGQDDGSELRGRLRKGFDQFHDVWLQNDRTVAQLIRALEADIVVDLNGHTHGGRLEILSHRPAPIQASYMGYAGTTGADFIDYVIADAVVAPFEHQAFFTEKIVHLPHSYWVSDPQQRIGTTPTRGEAGLPEEGFVFCSFNNHWKITAPLFDVWMRLLRAVPGSVLWLKQSGEIIERRLRAQAALRGIEPERLVFAGRVPLDMHFARHRLGDLFLDTLPYNAHATAGDALWAGLPVLTCEGEAYAGRVAASFLSALGLNELVTKNLADYEASALALSQDSARLRSLREKLQVARVAQPLYDADRTARAIESVYTTMWEIARARQAPRSFAVGAI